MKTFIHKNGTLENSDMYTYYGDLRHQQLRSFGWSWWRNSECNNCNSGCWITRH